VSALAQSARSNTGISSLRSVLWPVLPGIRGSRLRGWCRSRSEARSWRGQRRQWVAPRKRRSEHVSASPLIGLGASGENHMQLATSGGRDRPPAGTYSHRHCVPVPTMAATKQAAVCTIGARFGSALSSGIRLLVAFVLQRRIERGIRAGLGHAGFDPARTSATGLPASPEAFGELP